jgi:hypothetical protein
MSGSITQHLVCHARSITRRPQRALRNYVPILLRGLLYAVVFVLAHGLLMHAMRSGQRWLVGAVAVSAAIGMALTRRGWQQAHTEESAKLAEDIRAAWRDVDISQEKVALSIDVPKSHLSDQMAGREMLSAWKLWSLPAAFKVALAKRILARYAPDVVVIESEALRELVGVIQEMQPRRLTLARARKDVA